MEVEIVMLRNKGMQKERDGEEKEKGNERERGMGTREREKQGPSERKQIIDVHSTTEKREGYAEILKKMKEKINTEEIGVKLNAKKTARGSVRLEVKEIKTGGGNKLKKNLQEHMGEELKVDES